MGQSPATRENGHEFSKYRLKEPLSESFLGTRYRAVSAVAGTVRAASNAFGTDLSTWRSSAFALRLLRAHTPSLIDRVARAAKAVRYIEHPSLLAPIQLIRAQTKLGVISQDIDGVTLSDAMSVSSARGDALPQSIALRIALDVLAGLQALHEAEGNVQRYLFACGGLTPDSIHIGSDGRTRLIDPGVAGAAAGVPHWGHDPIALAYTAPDQTGADPRFTPSSDAFSVGVVLWEMLSGLPLFGAGTAAETLERLHNAPVPRVQRPQFVRGEPISAAVAQVVAHALVRDPSQRFASCKTLAETLEDAADAASHLLVAEYCHRLPSSSARAFSDSAELIARRDDETGQMSGIGPIQGERSDSFSVSANSFEPATERISAPILDLALSAPRQTGTVAQVITAFPISDFKPAPAEEPTRRYHAPIAIAAGILLGLSYLAWQEHGESARAPDAPHSTAAAARPTATQTTTQVSTKTATKTATQVSTRADLRVDPGPDPTAPEREQSAPARPGIVISRDDQVLSPNPPTSATSRPRDEPPSTPIVTSVTPVTITPEAPAAQPATASSRASARKAEASRRRPASTPEPSADPSTAGLKFIPADL